ncbi:LIM domain-containing protein jub-like isoform X2 [Paramacrobiotus metropolitanus]|uniref:LIM domain-containing protein jub-like isoform X2 n=1 Tax=Paramacrobiotus metropolitanus TaxID=2943436 RepID=UPI002445F812|nr:LIM domain-containing protein jub-like isoform X2 [Paramacrobiotus metropolitanus]
MPAVTKKNKEFLADKTAAEPVLQRSGNEEWTAKMSGQAGRATGSSNWKLFSPPPPYSESAPAAAQEKSQRKLNDFGTGRRLGDCQSAFLAAAATSTPDCSTNGQSIAFASQAASFATSPSISDCGTHGAHLTSSIQRGNCARALTSSESKRRAFHPASLTPLANPHGAGFSLLPVPADGRTFSGGADNCPCRPIVNPTNTSAGCTCHLQLRLSFQGGGCTTGLSPLPHHSCSASVASSPRSSISTLASRSSYAELRHLLASPCSSPHNCTPSPALLGQCGCPFPSDSAGPHGERRWITTPTCGCHRIPAGNGVESLASQYCTSPVRSLSGLLRQTHPAKPPFPSREHSRAELCPGAASPTGTVIIHDSMIPASGRSPSKPHMPAEADKSALHLRSHDAAASGDRNALLATATNRREQPYFARPIASAEAVRTNNMARSANHKQPCSSTCAAAGCGTQVADSGNVLAVCRSHQNAGERSYLDRAPVTKGPVRGVIGTGVGAASAEARMHRAARNISAAVFSQPCSEELEDPPPYKPAAPTARPKVVVPTAVVSSGEQKAASAQVEQKLANLEEELARQNLRDEDDYDDEEYFGFCYLCGERVIGVEQACQAMGNLYHTKCFTCIICGRTLRGKAFYHVRGKIMCEEDYLYSGFQNSADKCVACGHLIMDMILQALGKSYHPGCFRCCVCSKALDGIPFTADVEGSIYCVEDYRGARKRRCASSQWSVISMWTAMFARTVERS